VSEEDKMSASHPPGSRDERDPKKWFENMWVQLLGVTGAILLFVLVAGLILDWYINPGGDSKARRDLVQALALLTAGVAGGFGIYFTWRGQRITREAQEDNQRNTKQQLDITQQGQITDRFTRAIELLGATNDDHNGEKRSNIEQRMGAIYALEQIARESEIHHDTIEAIMAAYIRQNAPLMPEGQDSPEREKHGLGHVNLDIQATLDVIGRLAVGLDRWEKGRIVRLEKTDLRNALFLGGNFTNIWFQRADLRYAGIINPDCRRSKFRFANLKGAVIHEKTKLTETDFYEAELEDTMVAGVDLSETINLTQKQIDQAWGDKITKLPAGLERPTHWPDTWDDKQAAED
jgi:hypothetical protein